jgi:hypothetical protein
MKETKNDKKGAYSIKITKKATQIPVLFQSSVKSKDRGPSVKSKD